MKSAPRSGRIFTKTHEGQSDSQDAVVKQRTVGLVPPYASRCFGVHTWVSYRALRDEDLVAKTYR